MHHIQRKILSKLLYAPSLGYAQMRPKDIESNHYAYHLDRLMQAGYIKKHGREYSLTTKGLALADRISHDTFDVRLQPHIITAIHVMNDVGQLLLYEHAFQPYLQRFGPPQGRVHYEEHVADAAVRELHEKAGLTGVPLKHRGMAYVHAMQGGDDISKTLMHVFSGSVIGAPPLRAPTEKGGCSWIDYKQLAANRLMPGFKQVRELLARKGGFFFDEIETEL